ncbi:hypothetical protein HNP32_002273 [Brevundimonas bullata]|uniref:Uncharacterized protein n=1 Tax=Brevundimonas bullata TaxID=13160 RepID=A0A7W7N4N0_9CAUL|nr:hypothetical protein [Brevundimonas bullata]MBB4798529.1 hypothetical protein [Brevundimonas bullata]MBB6383156.1 hypothetical protein [Brevundimonas bullata]
MRQLLMLSLFAALSLGLSHAAQAADAAPPPQVETWSLQQTGAVGSSIFLQDRAAARATDALLARFGGKPPEGLIGWIVVPNGEDQLVRFLVGEPTAPRPGYDIVVDKNGRAGAVIEATDTALTDDQAVRYFARNTAASGIGALRCAARYNAVVLDDPDSDGWLVWLLASTTDANKVPMGGHYRFHVSADGRTLEKREQLSGGCLDLDRRQAQQGGQTVGLMTNVIVAPQPLEVHVFLSLLNRLPIYVMAGDKLWAVQGGVIREVDTSKRR